MPWVATRHLPSGRLAFKCPWACLDTGSCSPWDLTLHVYRVGTLEGFWSSVSALRPKGPHPPSLPEPHVCLPTQRDHHAPPLRRKPGSPGALQLCLFLPRATVLTACRPTSETVASCSFCSVCSLMVVGAASSQPNVCSVLHSQLRSTTHIFLKFPTSLET